MTISLGKSLFSSGASRSSSAYCPPACPKPSHSSSGVGVNVGVNVNIGGLGGWGAGSGSSGGGKGGWGSGIGSGSVGGGIGGIINNGLKGVGGWNTKNSQYAFQVGDGKNFMTGSGQGGFEFGMENKGGAIVGSGTPSGFELGISGKGVNGFARGTGHTTSFTAGVNGLLAQAGVVGNGKLSQLLDC